MRETPDFIRINWLQDHFMMTKCPAATFTKSGQCCGDRTQNIYMKTIKMVRTVGVFSGPSLASPSQGLDISLFLQPRRWPAWSLLPHSLPQTLSSPESSLSSWQWVIVMIIVMSATENNKMQSHCDHRGTLDHWTPTLWLLYTSASKGAAVGGIQQHVVNSMILMYV